MLLLLPALALFHPQGPGTSSAPVVINEFSNDDAGTDDKDFVELYNRSGSPVDISGWSLVGEEGTVGSAANGVFTFPGAPGSATTVLQPGQFLVVGMANTPNVDFIISGASPGLVLENTDADGVSLRDDLGNVVDSVLWGFARWTAPVPPWIEGHGLWGTYIWQDLTTQPLEGQLTAQRWIDGFDTNVNSADFVMMAATPGAPNGVLNVLPPALVETCDGLVGSALRDFSFSFVPPTVFDPSAVTVATGAVRNYPPSPQGGNLARIQDPTGGGNVVQANVLVLDDFLAELYVYVTGGNPAIASPGQGEAWAFGVRGSTDAFAAPFDVPGTYYAQASLCVSAANQAPGATGLAWMGYVGPVQTDIYLVDLGDGGPGYTVLAGPITATSGVNDGWQRLRLRAKGNSFVANFGGNFGVDDGQRFTGALTTRLGMVYLQYRECVSVNANIGGLYIDRFEIFGAVDSAIAFAGTPAPTNAGTPSIATVGNPSVGNAAFAITASGLVPSGISIVSLDVGTLLPGIPVPGAQPSLRVYAAPTVTATVFNDPAGVGSLTFPIPPVNSLLGIPLSAQYFDLDPSLPFALPFGCSRGVQFAIGND